MKLPEEHARIAKAKKVNLVIILEISEERLKMLRERKVAERLIVACGTEKQEKGH